MHILVAGFVICLASAGTSAQSEKVSVRMVPQPGQSARLAMTQEMDFDMSLDGAALPGLTPLNMQMRVTMVLTQKTGPRKADGTIDAELTYEQMRSEITMNGTTLPADANSQLLGKPVTVTYGGKGEILSVNGLPSGGITDDAFRQMMNSLMGNLPAAELGVGETTTVPLDVALPLPLPGSGPMRMSGETRIKLVSIDKDAQGRSARFGSTINGTMVSDMPSPDGKSRVTFDVTMGGDGTYVIDLDKGLPRSAITTSTINGKIGVPAGAAPDAALPSMILRGTVKVTMTSN